MDARRTTSKQWKTIKERTTVILGTVIRYTVKGQGGLTLRIEVQ
jgi:hypothetical protein